MRQTVERVKSGVVMKDILDCYPGIGEYQSILDYHLLFIPFSSLTHYLFLHSSIISSLHFTLLFEFFRYYTKAHHSCLLSPYFISLTLSPFSFFSISFFLLLEGECLNLIIGGDLIAFKNKALKSFVLFPR